MTCSNRQIRKLRQYVKQYTLEVSATKSGMSMNTARKYIKQSGRATQVEERRGRHKNSPFEDIWHEISNLLCCSPGLEAKTLLQWLIAREPERFQWSQLRTLQRRIKDWRVTDGPGKEIIFPQIKIPGKQSQSDFTNMNNLNITIDNKDFPHLLFHFMLPYSRWETVSVCFSESFDSLSEGFESAVWELGSVAREHRVDNLAAATHRSGNSRAFNDNWIEVMKYYGVKSTKNNPGIAHENGSVEKSHDLLKKAINQQLLIKGTRNFSSLDDYKEFLKHVCDSRNSVRKELLSEEIKYLLPLPDCKWEGPKFINPKVTPFSTIQVMKGTYSVPSRLIGIDLKVYVYPKVVDIYYGNKKILSVTRLLNDQGENINYRHVVSHLLRKPGAFKNYLYREHLFPRLIFRKTYDVLLEKTPSKSSKHYLEILHLAAIGNEGDVAAALELLLEDKKLPVSKNVKALLDMIEPKPPVVEVMEPNLNQYDQLVKNTEVRTDATIH